MQQKSDKPYILAPAWFNAKKSGLQSKVTPAPYTPHTDQSFVHGPCEPFDVYCAVFPKGREGRGQTQA